MDKQRAKYILKNTGYIDNKVGAAFEVAIKSMDKLEKIEQIIDDCDLETWEVLKLKKIKEVLGNE